MPTQKGGYFVDGVKVPSVTTILSRFKESGALMYWAWKQGTEGKDYKATSGRAASIGTVVHDRVDAHIHARVWTPPPDLDEEFVRKSDNGFGAFLEWAGGSKLVPRETEFPLVSQKLKFGGTPDAMLVNGKLALGDWKTSNAIYVDMLAQLGGYKVLWEENFPDQVIDGGYHILRFDKEHGDFHHHWFSNIDDGVGMFLALRQAYDFDQKLKARVR